MENTHSKGRGGIAGHSASSSPAIRRRESGPRPGRTPRDPSDRSRFPVERPRTLLSDAGILFDAEPADLDERVLELPLLASGSAPDTIALRLAEEKALAVARRRPEALVIGCDQTLDLEGRRFNKAETREAAADQLRALRGKTHALHSAVVIVEDGAVTWSHVSTAKLTMRLSARTSSPIISTASATACSAASAPISSKGSACSSSTRSTATSSPFSACRCCRSRSGCAPREICGHEHCDAIAADARGVAVADRHSRSRSSSAIGSPSTASPDPMSGVPVAPTRRKPSSPISRAATSPGSQRDGAPQGTRGARLRRARARRRRTRRRDTLVGRETAGSTAPTPTSRASSPIATRARQAGTRIRARRSCSAPAARRAP